MPHTGLQSPERRDGAVIFVGGFNAGQAVRTYIHHLLKLRPGLRERVQQFSCRDNPDHIVKQLVSADGPVTLVGNITPKIELPLQSVVARQIRVQGSCASSGEYPACIDLLSRGAIRVEPMISATAPLEEGPEWFERLYRQEPNLMKVILRP